MAAVTSPLIGNNSRKTVKIPYREVIAQLFRTGLRSNEEDPPAESEDGCYASLLLFISVCSLGSVMIFSCMMTTNSITYGLVSISMITLISFDIGVMLYFMRMKEKWMNVSQGLVLWATDDRHQTSRLSLIGIYIFGSASLIMFFIDIVQVATCIQFSFKEYETDRYGNEDILYVIFRTIANIFLCVQMAFFVCFKNTKFVSTPCFCYAFLLFVTVNFICLLEGLMYIGSVRLDVTLPWQSRPPPMNLSSGCYNSSRVFDKSVLVVQDILYPFAIEFYILSIGIFLHHWFSLVPIESKIIINRRTYVNEVDRARVGANYQSETSHHCSYALPIAVFLSLLLIGSAAFLQSKNLVGIVIYIYHTIRLIYQSLLIIPVLLGVRYLSYFRYDRKPSLDGSEMLLFSTVTGTFLVTAFTLVTSSTLLHHFATHTLSSDDINGTEATQNFHVTATDSTLCLAYSIVNYIQTTVQTCFFVSARRRVPLRLETVTSYRLRECFLYLAVCNAFILATDTFFALHTFRVESATNVWYFGDRYWSILESVLFPVAELYHFHSVLLCSELYLSFKVD